ncbi:MAG: carboxypeptidase-like regulatory domain-containing protein [Methanocella sp.]
MRRERPVIGIRRGRPLVPLSIGVSQKGFQVAGFRFKMTAAAFICGLIIVCSLLALTACDAKAAGNATATPVNNSTTITPTPVATPAPTPAPRQVFSDPRWDTDHVSIMVTNGGAPITVEAYIDTPSNKNIVPVDSGISKRVSTLAITPENGRIVSYGFKAYENGTLIQSYENSIVVSASPTPLPETAIVTGKVSDTASNAPIAGAEVTFVPRDFDRNYPSVNTDSSGSFTTTGKMSPGIYYLTVKASGYSPKTLTVEVGNGPQQMSDPIKLDSTAVASPTATPGPTPSPTPGSPVDAWVSLIYNPTVCISTLALTLGAIVSATAIYEWMLRQRERRKKEGEKK